MIKVPQPDVIPGLPLCEVSFAGSHTMKDDRLLTSFGGRDVSDIAGRNAEELAKSLALMHATLESTTDAILVTDESNQVRAFNEKYINLWAILAPS